MAVTSLRLDEHYILWYKNAATFVFTLVVPLAFLAYWNANTYRLMSKSASPIGQRTAKPASTTISVTNGSSGAVKTNGAGGASCPVAAIKNEENRKARILFAIIAAFAACHTLRFVLNFEELVAARDYVWADKHRCNVHPFWALVTAHCSELAICLNASAGFIVYCVMSPDFRREMSARLGSVRRPAPTVM